MCIEDDNTLVQIEKELIALSSLMGSENSDFRTLLLNPAFRKEEQSQVASELCAALKLHALTQNLLLVLIEKGRVSLLSLIGKAFSSEVDAKLSRARAKITTASPLNDHDLAEVIESLRHRAGKHVIAEVEVDERAGMGVKAQIGGMVFDATLSTMLERFKRQLVETPIGA
jgi:F-type H+-transporting ATPase subunit delta